jgi:hypothetical protein
MLAYVSAIAAICATLVSAQGLMTGSDMLFSNPGAELPDMYISESVVVMQENTTDATLYAVVLTHTPGMREDETIENDEVRICLTSSQEHFQQDDTTRKKEYGVFEERRTYNTQLIIHICDNHGDKTKDIATDFMVAHFGTTGVAAAGSTTEMSDGPASATMPLGPVLKICKTYSIVSGNIPEQQISLDATTDRVDSIIRVACPMCKCFTIDKATFQPIAKKTMDAFSNVKGPPKAGDINALIDAITIDGTFYRSEVRMTTAIFRKYFFSGYQWYSRSRWWASLG